MQTDGEVRVIIEVENNTLFQSHPTHTHTHTHTIRDDI